MERRKFSDEDDTKTPADISELTDNIHDAGGERRKALEICLNHVRNAETPAEKDYWTLQAMVFGDIYDEYTQKMYPELFPGNNPHAPEPEE